MAITISGNGISSDAIASLAASKLTGQVPDANAPSGSVLQVISTTKTDTFSTTSTSFVDITGLSVNITPSSTSSRILVLAFLTTSGSSASQQAFVRLLRDSTAVLVGDSAGSRIRATTAGRNSDNADSRNQSFTFVDSPSTTSSTTYKVQLAVQADTMYVNRSNDDADSTSRWRTTATITVMEIAA